MNPFEFVLAVIVVAADRQWCSSRYAHRATDEDFERARSRAATDARAPTRPRRDRSRLRDEVKELKERIKVLERITVEKENSLLKEIESLRDR